MTLGKFLQNALPAGIFFVSATTAIDSYAQAPISPGTQVPLPNWQQYQQILEQASQRSMEQMRQYLPPPIQNNRPLIGYFSNGEVEWLWVNGTRFDMNSCDDRLKLKKFVSEGRHNFASQVSMPSGYEPITQVSFEAHALNLDCTLTQKAKRWFQK